MTTAQNIVDLLTAYATNAGKAGWPCYIELPSGQRVEIAELKIINPDEVLIPQGTTPEQAMIIFRATDPGV